MEFDWLDDDELYGMNINPANGLPMIDHSPIDVAGNLYGTDSAFAIPNFASPTFPWSS